LPMRRRVRHAAAVLPPRAASARVPAARPRAPAPPGPPDRDAPRPSPVCAAAGEKAARRRRSKPPPPARFPPRRACALGCLPARPLLGRRAGLPAREPAGRPALGRRARAMRRRRAWPGRPSRAEELPSLPFFWMTTGSRGSSFVFFFVVFS